MTTGIAIDLGVLPAGTFPGLELEYFPFVPVDGFADANARCTGLMRWDYGITKDGSNRVSSQKGFFDNTAIQANDDLKPVYTPNALGTGFDGLVFDGVNDVLMTSLVPGTQGLMVCAGKTPASVAASQIIMGGSSGTSQVVGLGIRFASGVIRVAAQLGVKSVGAFSGSGADASLAANTDYVLAVRWDGALGRLYVNGVFQSVIGAQDYVTGSPAGSAGVGPLAIGARRVSGGFDTYSSWTHGYDGLYVGNYTDAEVMAISQAFGARNGQIF